MKTIRESKRSMRGMLQAAGAAVVALTSGAMAGCQSTSGAKDFDPIIPQFFLETQAQDPAATVAVLPRSGVAIPIRPSVVLSEGDVANVELVRVDLGLCLLFVFQGESARDLLRITGANLGRRLVVTLNGRAFGARVIDAPINDGRLFMFVEIPDEALEQTVVDLKRTTSEIQSALARARP